MAPAFAGRKRGRKDCVAGAVAAGRGRDARSEENGQDVVLPLFV